MLREGEPDRGLSPLAWVVCVLVWVMVICGGRWVTCLFSP